MRKEAYHMLERGRAKRVRVNGRTSVKGHSNVPIPIRGVRRTQVVDFNAGGLGLHTDKCYSRFAFVHGKVQLQTETQQRHFKWRGVVVWSEYDKEKQAYHTGICFMRRLQLSSIAELLRDD